MPVLSTDTARLNGMPKPSAATTPFHLVYGGDSYLNDQTVRDLKHEAQRRYPDAETIELDAANADHYAFDEAVSPSLLADRAIVIVTNLQNADEKLGDAMVSYCRQACKEPADACIVICQHEGGVKGKRLVEQLTKAGAYKDAVADLKKPEAKLNFVMQCFERRKRRVEPMAAQQLVAVLGDRTGELAAMVGQLCFDFDDNPMTSTASTNISPPIRRWMASVSPTSRCRDVRRTRSSPCDRPWNRAPLRSRLSARWP